MKKRASHTTTSSAKLRCVDLFAGAGGFTLAARNAGLAVIAAVEKSGIGAVIPGILKVDSSYVKAGGALAVFVVVFLLKPAIIGSVAHLVAPPQSPLPVIEGYLSAIDAGKLDAAWEMLDDEAKRGVARDRDAYRQAYVGGRTPLGAVIGRVQNGIQEVRSPSGYPVGIYRIVSFRTKFQIGTCHAEMVSVRATDDLVWRPFDHNVSPLPVPCIDGILPPP